MEHYAGLDVSLEQMSVCVVDARKAKWYATKVASEPEALVSFLGREDLEIARVGLEAGPLSQWLHAGLSLAATRRCLAQRKDESVDVAHAASPSCLCCSNIAILQDC